MKPDTPISEIRTGRPVQQALAVAGVRTLADLTRWTEQELLDLHGVGPKGLRILREALVAAKLSFKAVT